MELGGDAMFRILHDTSTTSMSTAWDSSSQGTGIPTSLLYSVFDSDDHPYGVVVVLTQWASCGFLRKQTKSLKGMLPADVASLD